LIDAKGYCDVFTDNPETATQIYESLANEGLTVTLTK
jgi:esterase/lipase superfamily enzyme